MDPGSPDRAARVARADWRAAKEAERAADAVARSLGATNPLYQRALLLSGRPKATAVQLLLALKDNQCPLDRGTLKAMGRALAEVALPASGGATEGATANDLTATGEAPEDQAKVSAMVEQLRALASSERRDAADAAKLSPPAKAAPAAGTAAFTTPPTAATGAARDKKSRDQARHAQGQAWIAKQSEYYSHPCCREFEFSASPEVVAQFPAHELVILPAMPYWGPLSEAIAQQNPAAQRRTPLAILLVALNALEVAYAGPAPQGTTEGELDQRTLKHREDPHGPEMDRCPTLSTSVAQALIAKVTAALLPLDLKDQESMAAAIWDEVARAAYCHGKETLTHALQYVMKGPSLERAFAMGNPWLDPKTGAVRTEKAKSAPQAGPSGKGAGGGSDRTPGAKPKRQGTCRDYSQGQCHYGSRCKYRHASEGPQGPPNKKAAGDRASGGGDPHDK